GLADLEQSRPDPVAVTDTDLVVGHPLHGEVLAELAVGEVVSAEELLPAAVRLDLIDEHRPVDAAVPVHVALPVAVDVEAADHPATVYRVLPDPGVDDPSFPLDVARHADVHRQQSASRRCHPASTSGAAFENRLECGSVVVVEPRLVLEAPAGDTHRVS